MKVKLLDVFVSHSSLSLSLCSWLQQYRSWCLTKTAVAAVAAMFVPCVSSMLYQSSKVIR